VSLRLVTQTTAELVDYATVPIAYLVDRRFDVAIDDHGLGGVTLTEVPVEPAWVKDYDALEGEGPTRWPKRFDTTNWGVIAAFDDDTRVGGAVLAYRTPDCWLLEGRDDLAVLWDIRVRPDARGCGVGRAIYGAAISWARERECRHLKIETQNVNVPACRFYVAMGCELAAVNRFAYPDLPDEVELDWVWDIAADA
jgi:GNAT superfamily N-acetyltransferase